MKTLKNEGLKTIETKIRSIKVGRMLSALVLAAAMLAPHPVAASAATVCATINGGGTAQMLGPVGLGTTHWGAGITLNCDGTASGHFDCVDQHGDVTGAGNPSAGNIFGDVTSWSTEANGTIIVLHVVGKLVNFPGGHPQDVAFNVRILQFGGAGVGRWTLGFGAFIFCNELLTSGQIVIRYS